MTDRAIAVEERVRERYNEKAELYPQFYEGASWLAHFYRTRIERVCELLRDGGGLKVLEVGCGPAMLTEKLVDMGCEYRGVDISEKMISGCEERFGHLGDAHFSVGTVRQLQFPASSFDVVLCLGAIEYVTDKRGAVAEMARMLHRGGNLIISANNMWSPRNLWNRWVRTWAGQGQDVAVKAFHSEREYRKLLARNFAVQQVRYFDFSLLPAPIAERFPNIVRAIDQQLDFLRRTALRRLGNGFLVQARKP